MASRMFYNSSFNQDISKWNLEKAATTDIFKKSPLAFDFNGWKRPKMK